MQRYLASLLLALSITACDDESIERPVIEPEPRCGDAMLDEGEACDEGGESKICDVDCTAPVCGDGTTNEAAGEQCDDGNTRSEDGCSFNCQMEELK